MSEKFGLDAFGDMVDKFLEENEIEMLLTMPKGTLHVQVDDNVNLGPTVQFFILLNSIEAICKEMRNLLGIDTVSPEWEKTVNVMLGMVKREILTEDEEGVE